MAGKQSSGETADIIKPVKWRPSDYKKIQEALPPRMGFSTYVKGAALEKASREAEDEPKFKPIPLYGLIQAGEATDIRPLPDGGVVYPPFEVPSDCYALTVVGDSMDAEYGKTIPDGSYAAFCPDRFAGLGALVHVEWEEVGRTVATFKKYVPLANGDAEFHPLNQPKHKPIERKKGEFEIKGVFRRAWKGDQ